MSVKRLGKGLGALIRTDREIDLNKDSELNDNSSSVSKIKVSEIKANPNQPRRFFDEKKLLELVDSIKQKGLITPITVRKRISGYELVAGERRWRASQKAKKKVIPAYVIEVENESEILELALIENIQRENLNPIEESEAYAALNSKFKMSHGSIANSVGKSRASVSNSLRLLQLPSEIRRSIRVGDITPGHARAILQAKTTKKMYDFWNKIKSKQLNVREAEILVKEKKNLKKPKVIKKENNQIQLIENQFIEILGTKVKIKPRKDGGFIEVSYFSNDDLDRILELMNKSR
ncbi:ParB/RepB/Spo0J family partition protein [Candidatus Marinimicrobia bacterium]|nr:ParB/RepB/Spo0J family partition protein [Candidatus Neomarinimicrobiota bacterium]